MVGVEPTRVSSLGPKPSASASSATSAISGYLKSSLQYWPEPDFEGGVIYYLLLQGVFIVFVIERRRFVIGTKNLRSD